MSADEDFLARWSRRKREIADADKAAESAQRDIAATPQDRGADGEQNTAVEFDPASLPPIESITSISDIRDFLRAGVPAELTRAALRRAWSADPAIRDFVGLAENAWDFTDPKAMPGFGPLEATDDIQKMLAQIMSRSDELPAGESQKAAELKPDSAVLASNAAPEDDGRTAPIEPDSTADATVTPITQAAPPCAGEPGAAAQQPDSEPKPLNNLSRRFHGGALPHLPLVIV